MKKIMVMLFMVLSVFAAAACGNSAEDAETTEVIVFAASSMTETLTEISEMYKEIAPEVTLIFNFDSSGTLKTQIEAGAACDLFISAGQKQMDELACAEMDTRIDLLENKVVLPVSDEHRKELTSFDYMAEDLRSGSILLAMGNSDVPVGQYTQKILAYYGLNEEILANAGVITYGSNVKEVTTQVKEGVVDCGIIYCTDAFSADLNIVDAATEGMCGQVIYPAALMQTSLHKEEAKAFLEYLTSAEAMSVFESVGFTAVE